MSLYFFISIRYFGLYQKLMLQVVNYAGELWFKWVRNFLYAFSGRLLLPLIFYAGSYIPAFQNMRYMGPWWEYFSFAIIFYYTAITGYSKAIETKVPFKLNLLTYKPSLLLSSSTAIIEKSFFIEDAEIIEIINTKTAIREDAVLLTQCKPKITDLLQHGKVYQNPELSLTQLEKHLQTNPSVISRVINQGFQLNFNDFINQYRIEGVMDKYGGHF